MKLILLLAAQLLLPRSVLAAGPGWFLDAETGYAYADHNTVKIPLEGGTRFSLTDELEAGGAPFLRLRAGRTRGAHEFSVLAAPLTLKSEGSFDRAVVFNGRTFAAGVPVKATYRFNSYRVKYLREFRRTETLRLRWGGALKLRHAGIKLDDGTQRTESKNTGFVPLAAFCLDWAFRPGWSVLFDFEGLAAPQGRAEDALLAVARDLRPGLKARAGYRFLEGGSGAGEVYTFAYIHYLSAGLTWEF